MWKVIYARVPSGRRGRRRGTDLHRDLHTAGPVGGHVTVKKEGRTLIDQDLTTKVQPQKGWAVEKQEAGPE